MTDLSPETVGTTPPDDPRADDMAVTAALVSLTASGISTDVLEMLVGGDGRGTIRPGALRRALAAARSHGGM